MRQNNPSLYFSSDFPDSLLCIFFDNKVLRFIAGELFVFVLYCVRYSVDYKNVANSNQFSDERIAKVEKYIKIQPITFALFLASAVLIFAF